MMFSRLRQVLQQLDLEEKILNAGAFIGLIGVVCPWIGGEWLGGTPVLHTGFGFYTSFLGLAVFLLNGFILFVSLSPILGGPTLLRREQRSIVLLVASAQAVVLSIAALSVLTRVAFEFSRVEIRFGIYMSMIGSLTAGLYGFLKWQEERRQMAESFFYHEEPAKKDEGFPSPGLHPSQRGARIQGRGSEQSKIYESHIPPPSSPRKPEPVVLKKIEVPVGEPEGRRELIEKIKEESVRLPELEVSPPSPQSKVIPKAPAVEEHPIFRGL